MDFRNNADRIMRELIREMGTQTAVAKALKTKKTTFNYWLNHANQVSLDHVARMKALLAKLKGEPSILNEVSDTFSTSTKSLLPLSVRVKQAMQYEKNIGERRGRGMKKTYEIRPTADEFLGRTDEQVAKKWGLGGKGTYRYAKQVVMRQHCELINAMDEGWLPVSYAAALITLSDQHIQCLLEKGIVTIKSYIQQRKKTTLKNKARLEDKRRSFALLLSTLKMNIYEDSLLLQAEQHTSLPLRAIVLGLFLHCNEAGHFLWQIPLLEQSLLPYTQVDIAKALEALCGYGIIKKVVIDSKKYGCIALWEKLMQACE